MSKKTSTRTSDAFIDTFKELVLALCQHPEGCRFNETWGQNVIITVTPNERDYGRVLGKRPKEPLPGFPREMRTLEGLKVVFNLMARRNNHKNGDVSLKGGRPWTPGFVPTVPEIVPHDPNWMPSKIEKLVYDVGGEMFGQVRVAFDPVNETETKLSMFISGRALPGVEAALQTVFATVGAMSGKTIMFELVEGADEE